MELQEQQESKEIVLNEKYEPLFEDHGCRYVLMTGGRGSAKSFSLGTFLRYYMTEVKNNTFLFTRWTKSSAFASIIKEVLEKDEMLGLENRTSKTGDTIIDLETNTELMFRGIKTSSGNQTANLKSLTNLSVFVIDEAEELADESVFDRIAQSVRVKGQRNLIIISMNPSNKDHWIYKRFFEEAGVDPKFNGIHDDVLYIYTTYLDNIDNLDEGYLRDIERTKEKRYQRYRHQYLGEWIDDDESALWTYKMINEARSLYDDSLPNWTIAIGVDPSVSSSGNQDECGIVVCAKIGEDKYVVLEDATGVYTPSEWGRKTCEMYEKWDADCIVVETNQGGDLCVDNIRNASTISSGMSLPVQKVHASKGKIPRAEPIATLYELGCVAHAPGLKDLEQEIVTFTSKSKDSPGRLDAMVWALTHLSKKKKVPFMVL